MKNANTSKSLATATAFLTSRAATTSVVGALSSLSFTLRDPSLLPLDGGGADEKTFSVFNPANKNVIATVESMGKVDTTRAIDEASKALPSWKDETTGVQRGAILQKWSDLLHANTDDLATIMTLESGKPLAESRGEVSYAASFLSYYAGEALRPTSAGGGIIIPTPFSSGAGAAPRGTLLAMKEAVGVTGLITPWNFPLAMITRKVGPALAVGCTVVLKPSELTPLCALAVRRLGERAGLPPGVFELVTSDTATTPEVGDELCTNPNVKKISFTGSTPVGKYLMKRSSDTVKRLSLELGGNAPFIVFPSADLPAAVQATLASKFRNAGQTCVCADRFLVHSSINDEYLSLLLDAMEKQIVVGDGSEEGVTMGPLITSRAVDNVMEKIDEAVSMGARVVTGGSRLASLGDNFMEATVVTDVDPDSRLWKEETFGPVIALRSFDTEEEAIDLANDVNVGLASYFCGGDMGQVMRVIKRLETGMVGVNTGIMSTAVAPFGGVKESGLGREGSPIGIEEYLETKYVYLDS
eukprot:CAMPEP_0172488906 /NCGR_PEP_ID=MMETSP1066-20121228/18619_1 /TAXON_ID=671091 /ORGANISM="Coscinodiscus wailesii, Strain CCMP2513" /LENGTH=526 /DNA_ID=CAMNT_0013256407 /DNA_START=190 /DNA_END=1770 /DNA_ORIENTATION=+